MQSKTIPELSPRNGSLPVAISYSTTPNENKSVRASKGLRADLLRRHVRHRPERAPWIGRLVFDGDGRLRRGACTRACAGAA